MEKISILWVTCDKYGDYELYKDEPYGVEGEWHAFSESIPICSDLISGITYENSPVKVRIIPLENLD